MFLCFPIIFIISISETRSERSLSVASSGESKSGKQKCQEESKCFVKLSIQLLHRHVGFWW